MPLGGDYSDGVPRISYRVARADGEVLAERDAERGYYAASTVKLAVLAALARQLAEGEVSLADTLPSRDHFASVVPGAPDFALEHDGGDDQMAPPGEPMTVAELARQMVVISSNRATNVLLERVGLAAVAQAITDSGASGVAMGRQFGDVAAARRHGQANWVCASGLVRLLSAVLTGKLCPPRWTVWMTDLLEAQQHPGLAADVPPGTRWGSKSGWVTAVRHDVAWFGDPGPDALVVAVCSSGMAAADAGEAIAAIGRLALALAEAPSGEDSA